MPPFQLENAREADLELVERLVSEALLPLAGLRDQFPRGFVLAKAGESLVGAAGLERYGHVGLLRSLAVANETRGRGVGASLVGDRVAWAKEARLEAVYALTTTAGAFLQRLGFVPTDRSRVPPLLASSPEFAVACPASAACLMLQTGGKP